MQISGNLDNLYESLYDALNQNYMSLGDCRYVDLGLGTHRVKCRVHPKFRLLLVAEDVFVWEKFPIPLINRLEKHYLGWETMLNEGQVEMVSKLKKWVTSFSEVQVPMHERGRNYQQFTPGDVFIGFNDDILAAIVLRIDSNETTFAMADEEDETSYQDHILSKAKKVLLKCAAPDAIARLSDSLLDEDEREAACKEFYDSHKASLAHAISHLLGDAEEAGPTGNGVLFQVTTHSRLLTEQGRNEILKFVTKDDAYDEAATVDVAILPLQQMATQAQFDKEVAKFLDKTADEPGKRRVLLVQAQVLTKDQVSLVDCARYCITNAMQAHQPVDGQAPYAIGVVLQVPRVRGGWFSGFPGHPWISLHIDELRPNKHRLELADIENKTLSQILSLEDFVDLDNLIRDSIPKAVSLVPKEK